MTNKKDSPVFNPTITSQTKDESTVEIAISKGSNATSVKF